MQRLQRLLANRNLHKRVLSSIVLMPLALCALWAGGAVAVIIVAAEAVVIFYEWTRLSHGNRHSILFWLSQLLIVTAALLLILQANEFTAIFWIVLLILIGFIHFLFRNADSWQALGLLYALTLLVTLLLLRQSPTLGFESALFVLLTVWVTDTFAYFAGSLIGGPKLLPQVSPQKTWAGFYGGLFGAALASGLIALAFQLPKIHAVIFVGLLLSFAAQAGDLFESWIKRRFNAKDSGDLIPGHGGLLDRLDSLVAASLIAYLIGAARAGFAMPAEGLLLW